MYRIISIDTTDQAVARLGIHWAGAGDSAFVLFNVHDRITHVVATLLLIA